MTNSSMHIKKTECIDCNDAAWGKKHLSQYSDGHTYCHRCKTYTPRDCNNTFTLGTIKKDSPLALEFNKEQFIGSFQDLPERGISKETCELLGIMKGRIYNKDNCYLYMYDNGLNVRLPDKSFPWIEGKASECSMFGLSEATDYTKPVIITEGQFDTAACYEIGRQACSLNSGNGSALVSLTHDKEELLKYKEIWIGVDNDEAGRKAKEDIIKLCTEWGILDRLKIIDWSVYKDANEALLDKENHRIFLDMLDVHTRYWSPEGLTLAQDLDIDSFQINNIRTLEIPFAPRMHKMMVGYDYGCNYGILAGVGIGKTTWLTWQNLQIFLANPEVKIASLFYEEGEVVTPLRYVALKYGIPIGKLRRDRTLLSKEQWERVKDFYNHDRMAFLNNKADRTSKGLLQYITWLVKVKKFDMIVVDHLSYIIGRSGVSKNGERRDIDELVYAIQDLTNQLGCITLFVNHITESKDSQKSWADGLIPDLYGGRGSKVLAQIPDGVIALARDMKNVHNQSVCSSYILKSRWDGPLGKADSWVYLEDTGELRIHKSSP